MDFPWTVIFETAEGNIGAKNILAPSIPEEALKRAEEDLTYEKILGMVKGSHAENVYGIQILRNTTHQDQLAIPFTEEGHFS